MSNFTKFLTALKRQRKTQLKTDAFLSIFRETVPNYDRNGDMGASMLREALEQLHSSGDIEYSKNKNTWSMIGRTSVPATIRVRKNREETPEETAIEWDTRLAPVVHSKTNATQQDLILLDEFLKRQRTDPSSATTLRARSLAIFGDEKRLEKFRTPDWKGFLDGALSMKDLACSSPAGINFAFEVHDTPETYKVLLVENSETFYQLKRWNRWHGRYRAVAFGSGNTIQSSVPALGSLLSDLAADAFEYFGDIDDPGFVIPLSAIKKHAEIHPDEPALNLQPAKDLYRLCLEHGTPMPVTKSADFAAQRWTASTSSAVRSWLNDDEIHREIDQIISDGKRIAQEWVFTVP